MLISNPGVDAGDKTDGIIGYKKRRVSLKQGLASAFLRIQILEAMLTAIDLILDVNQDASLPGLTGFLFRRDAKSRTTDVRRRYFFYLSNA